MRHLFLVLITILLANSTSCISAQSKDKIKYAEAEAAISGASQTERYLPMISGKKVGIVANQSSKIGDEHIVDVLISRGVSVMKIFSPEHGFRGTAAEGAIVDNETDSKTGINIVSLYGANKKPRAEQLAGIETVVFDLQDVGVRFYTYISTLTLVMEACAENGIPLIVLDRPNPNGFYIDGPILEDENKSFVGMHNVPIVYGMTIGEYAMMVNGEGWLDKAQKCELTVVPMADYDRNTIYNLPTRPSPNLPNWQSVYLYPSLCLFEGTVVSVGRGTEQPFTCYGHPQMEGDFVFTPTSNSKYKPLYNNQLCKGYNLYFDDLENIEGHINLNYLLNAYEHIADKAAFFNNYFVKLTGTKQLQEQIEAGLNEEEIRESWQEGLDNFRKIRNKYLIYK